MRIKALRKAFGISQTKLGEVCGLTKATISQYENGKREPDIATMKKIAAYFGCTVDHLLGIDDDGQRVYTKEEQEMISLLEQLNEKELAELDTFVDFLISKRNGAK